MIRVARVNKVAPFFEYDVFDDTISSLKGGGGDDFGEDDDFDGTKVSTKRSPRRRGTINGCRGSRVAYALRSGCKRCRSRDTADSPRFE